MSRVQFKGRVARPKAQTAPLDVCRAIESFDTIEVVSDEFREMVAAQAPDLLSKLPPRKPRAPSIRSRRGLKRKPRS
jgi:hypothetical protein